MRTNTNFILVLVIWLGLGASVRAETPPEPPLVTLDQAVLQVQQDTDGRVLSAESRRIGRRLEYRIKVLTPDGHVKVMVVSSEPSKNASSTRSTKNSSGKSAGGKEKR